LTKKSRETLFNFWMGLLRQPINEGRAEYFVSYQPADAARELACINLVFPNENLNVAEVSKAMQREVAIWVKRFPVPSIAFAFDAKEDMISIPESPNASYLTAYAEPKNGNLVAGWGSGNVMPREQMTEEYRNLIYTHLPSRSQDDIRRKARRDTRATVRAAAVIVFFIAIVPVLIQVASLGVYWIGWILSLLSIGKGAYRAGQLFGWLKPSEKQKQKEKEDQLMRHHHYHCKLNPKGFERLKLENFEREAIERTRQEAEEIRRRM
jgi:hypothetical protein